MKNASHATVLGRGGVVVIDTHVLIWTVEDDPRLGDKAILAYGSQGHVAVNDAAR